MLKCGGGGGGFGGHQKVPFGHKGSSQCKSVHTAPLELIRVVYEQLHFQMLRIWACSRQDLPFLTYSDLRKNIIFEDIDFQIADQT